LRVTIGNQGPRLSEEQLRDFEDELTVQRLPESYRGFLLANNGGSPSPDTIDVPNWRVSTDVAIFFGLHRADQYWNDLRWNLELFREGRPIENALPIANDSSGDYFCLELHGAGAVVLFEPFDFENRYPVAPDFDTFIRGLRWFED